METEKIYETIVQLQSKDGKPIDIATICHECGIAKEILSSHLRILQMFHRIKITGGGKYVSVINT